MATPPTALRRMAVAAVTAVALAACGRGDNQSANRNGADTTSADTSAQGPFADSVGANEANKEAGFATARERLDSLQEAGRTPANGLDSAASRVQATTANEPGADTSRLNRNATPGGGSAGGRRTP